MYVYTFMTHGYFDYIKYLYEIMNTFIECMRVMLF